MKRKIRILCVATIACVLLVTFCLGSGPSPKSMTLKQRVADLERRVSLLEIHIEHIQEPNEPEDVKREALIKSHHLEEKKAQKEKKAQEVRERKRRDRIARDNNRQKRRDRKANEVRKRSGKRD